MGDDPALDAQPTPDTLRQRTLGRASFAFLLDQATSGIAGLPTVDALLVMAVNQANIAPLTREPLSRLRYGKLDAAAPDVRRRPVSINAVAASLRLPFETVRRRLRRLEALGVCTPTEGGVIVPEAFLVSPEYLQSIATAHHLLWVFFHDVRAGGWLADLPRSAYPTDDGVPVRAAARLLSDYLLRTAENLMAVSGDLVSTLVLLAILESEEPVGVPALSQRLAIPAETVRRHAVRLAAEDVCVRIGRGYAFPQAAFDRPAWRSILRNNVGNVQRLFGGLAERGLVEAWSRMPPPVRADDATAARSSPLAR